MIHVFLILFEALLFFRVTAAVKFNDVNSSQNRKPRKLKLLLMQINLTVRAHKENWLVFIYSLTLEL